MRLVVLGSSHHPIKSPYAGGLERFTADLARGLRRRGHYVELHGLEGCDESLADRFCPMPRLPELNGIASTEPDMPHPQFLHDQFVYTALLRDLMGRDDIDVVLDESLNHLPLAFASALKMPVLTTLHTPPFSWMEVGVWLAGNSGNFVAVSEAMRAQWTCRTDSHVILNGVDPDSLPMSTGGPDLAWAGRLTPEKGADLAIEAARRSGRRLRLAGPVADPAWFDSVVRPMLGPQAEYVGPLHGAALAELYGSSAATLITPRWEEPFCLVAAESQMCGTPVVGIRRGGLGEVVTGPGGVLVEPSESVVDDLAAAVKGAVTADRQQVGDHARDTLHWDRMLDGYEKLIADLCARRPANSSTYSQVVHRFSAGVQPVADVRVRT